MFDEEIEIVEEDKSLKAIRELESASTRLIEQRDIKTAIKYLFAALSIVIPATEECRLRLRLGILLLTYTSSIDLALEQLQKAQRLSVRQHQQLILMCALILGRALEQNGNYQMALKLYEEQLCNFENLPVNWFETFCICKARLLLMFNMKNNAEELLKKAIVFSNSGYLKAFLYFHFPNEQSAIELEAPLVYMKQILTSFKEMNYLQIEAPIRKLCNYNLISASDHITIINTKSYNQMMRLMSIAYAGIDGKQPLSVLINSLEEGVTEKSFLNIKSQLKSLFLSYMETTVEYLPSKNQNIEMAILGYENNSPVHKIKAHLLSALKIINSHTQCGNSKALVFLLLSWLYCQSDFEMAIKMSQSAGFLGELRENNLTIKLAHGILEKIYNLKGHMIEANYHKEQKNQIN